MRTGNRFAPILATALLLAACSPRGSGTSSTPPADLGAPTPTSDLGAAAPTSSLGVAPPPPVCRSAASGVVAQATGETSNGTLYFSARDRTHGDELWKSDGTEAGTVMVKDIRPGPGSSDPSGKTAVGSTLFFTANDGTHGRELWKSDGTRAGTVMVRDIGPGAKPWPWPIALVGVGGTLYFVNDDGTHGCELWKSDGTEAGTVMVKDIRPGSGSSTPDSLTDVDGTLYFEVANSTDGGELWRSDGTNDGTVLVQTAAGSIFAAVGDTLYLSISEPRQRPQLWKLVGSSGRTSWVKTFPFKHRPLLVPWPNVNVVDGTLYFNVGSSSALWKTDGTTAGTVLVKNIWPGGNGCCGYSNTWSGAIVGSTFYFVAYDAAHFYQVWKSDGTDTGTVLVKDIDQAEEEFPYGLTGVGATLYFVAHDRILGQGLWKSDGTDAGTVIVRPTMFGGNLALTEDLTDAGATTLFFTASDPSHGGELWRSDGTATGTVMVKDIRSGWASSAPSEFVYVPRRALLRTGAVVTTWPELSS